ARGLGRRADDRGRAVRGLAARRAVRTARADVSLAVWDVAAVERPRTAKRAGVRGLPEFAARLTAGKADDRHLSAAAAAVRLHGLRGVERTFDVAQQSPQLRRFGGLD